MKTFLVCILHNGTFFTKMFNAASIPDAWTDACSNILPDAEIVAVIEKVPDPIVNHKNEENEQKSEAL